MKLPTTSLIFRWAVTASIISLLAVMAKAQQMIGAKAGVVQYARGEVFFNGASFKLPNGSYRQMENSNTLSTKKGYAELILAPSVYLRLGEDASMQMRSNKLENTQLELIRGSASIEILEIFKTNPITVHAAGSIVEFKKAGLYRIDMVPGELRVYNGEALLKNGEKKVRVKKGKMVHLNGGFAPASFDPNFADALNLWAVQRSFVNAYYRFIGSLKYPRAGNTAIDPILKSFHDKSVRESEANAAREQLQKNPQELPGIP